MCTVISGCSLMPSDICITLQHLECTKCPLGLCQSFSMDDINIQMLSDHNLHIDCLSGRTEQHNINLVQSLSCVLLFATPWIAAHQASLSITNFRSSLRLMSIKLMMPSSHLILCCPLLLLPPVPPSVRVFSNESTLRMRWPKYWSFSFSISPSKEHPGLISFRTDF